MKKKYYKLKKMLKSLPFSFYFNYKEGQNS